MSQDVNDAGIYSNNNNNAPIPPKKNVPTSEFAIMVKILKTKRRYITKEMIKDLAEKYYSTNGRGITFSDLQKEFRISKEEAQRTLKHNKGFLFTAQDLSEEICKLIGLKRTIPQQYYLTAKKAEIIDRRKSNNVLKYTTGITSQFLDQQKIRYMQDWLCKVSEIHLFIHKLQIKLSIDKENYGLLSHLPIISNYRVHHERIGLREIEYQIHTNGTVMIHVSCSENAFRLQLEYDVSVIMMFIGRVEDRLKYLVSDTKEKVVPLVSNWILKRCDVNKDIEIDEIAQITLPDVQIPIFEKILRAYVKVIGEKAFYRFEKEVNPNKPLPDALEEIMKNADLDKDFLEQN